MGRRYSREQWREWFAEQKLSGDTISAFCQRKGIPDNSFYHWRKKLAEESGDGSDSEPLFAPVSVVGCRDVEVQFPGGISMRVPAERDAIRLVVDVLREQERETC